MKRASGPSQSSTSRTISSRRVFAEEKNYITQNAVHYECAAGSGPITTQDRGTSCGSLRRAGLSTACDRRHLRATVPSTPAVGSRSLFCGGFQCSSSKMSRKEAKTYLRLFERVVNLPVSGECDSQLRSPRGQGKGGGGLSPRDPPLSPPLRAPLSPQSTVMATVWMDPAQVSGRYFCHCSFSADWESASGQGRGQVSHRIPLCPCTLFTSGAAMSLYLQS